MTDEVPELLDPYRIENARSSRAKCKTCRRPIKKDTLRLGIMIEGPFGQGFLWHHLKCAAKRQGEAVEAAYAGNYFVEGIKPPTLESLRKLREAADEKKAKKKAPPYAEVAPTGRSKCRQCGELIEQGSLRVIIAKSVEFYGQKRTGAINVHGACLDTALSAEDCETKREGLAALLQAASPDVPADLLAPALAVCTE